MKLHIFVYKLLHNYLLSHWTLRASTNIGIVFVFVQAGYTTGMSSMSVDLPAYLVIYMIGKSSVIAVSYDAGPDGFDGYAL